MNKDELMMILSFGCLLLSVWYYFYMHKKYKNETGFIGNLEPKLLVIGSMIAFLSVILVNINK